MGRLGEHVHRLHRGEAEHPADHLVVLAPDPRGYAALSRMVTRAQFRGEKDRAVYDHGELVEADVAYERTAVCDDGIVIVDLDGVVRFANRGAEVMFEKSPTSGAGPGSATPCSPITLIPWASASSARSTTRCVSRRGCTART